MKIIDKIRQRAFFYSGKYFPSREKFSRYLYEKYPEHRELVDQVIKESEIYLNEENNLTFHFENYLLQKKGVRYIKTKLTQKLFPKSLIDSILSQNEDLQDWEKFKDSIERKIQNSQRKGKSKRFVINELSLAFPYFKDQISQLSDIVYNDELIVLHSTFSELVPLYKQSDRKGQAKIIQKLIGKGFSYDAIKKFLSAYEDSFE